MCLARCFNIDLGFPDGHEQHEPNKTISLIWLYFLEEEMDLLKDNLKKLYLRFLIPSLGSAMVMSIYTLTDAIVIGKGVGANALAALSITTPLLCILMAMGINLLTSYYLQSILSVKKSLCISLLRNVILSSIAIFCWI